jgi:hypothetical protein
MKEGNKREIPTNKGRALASCLNTKEDFKINLWVV